MFKNIMCILTIVTVVGVNGMDSELREKSANDLEVYRTYSADNGFDTWKKDGEQIFSETNLDIIKSSGIDNITDSKIGFNTWVFVTYNSAMFYGFWSPGWEQRFACEFIKQKIDALTASRGNPNVKAVISQLELILVYEPKSS